MEVTNLDPQVHRYLNQFVSTFSCCSLTGQIAIDVATQPPRPGDPSYHLFMTEKQSFQQKLAEKDHLTEETFNRVPGIRCNPIDSGVYAFPRIETPAKARETAKALHQEADLFYCLRLLEDTGYLLARGKCLGRGTAPITSG
uniref:alanine aminotransferase 2-like n=1 Tax=Pristiophorus japonicus TaxID=55135 RepID=UPI00398E7F94